MKKVTLVLAVAALSITIFSCANNTDKKSSTKNKTSSQPITMENLVGEWECVDITNGETHMESIAKMQPHIVFNDKNEIFSKMKLPDGSFTSKKNGSFSIEKGKVVSKSFDKCLYMVNNKLMKENPSEDNKQIYKKIIN
jgi:hypothetical protein